MNNSSFLLKSYFGSSWVCWQDSKSFEAKLTKVYKFQRLELINIYIREICVIWKTWQTNKLWTSTTSSQKVKKQPLSNVKLRSIFWFRSLKDTLNPSVPSNRECYPTCWKCSRKTTQLSGASNKYLFCYLVAEQEREK